MSTPTLHLAVCPRCAENFLSTFEAIDDWEDVCEKCYEDFLLDLYPDLDWQAEYHHL